MSQRDWNGVRFAGAAKGGHSESYFLKLNDPTGRRALWLKATILKKLDAGPVAEVWAIAFDREGEHIGVKEVMPFTDASFSREAFDVRAGRVRFRDGRVEGAVSMDGHEVEWELDFTTDAPPLVPFPSERMYADSMPYWKFVSPHPDSRFQGKYRVDGQDVVVDGWHGMQGHNWGKRHTEFYAWGHCNQWDDADELVFEGASGQPKIGPVMAPMVSMFFVYHRGVRYSFNEPKYLLKTKADVTLRRWEFSAENDLARVEGAIHASTDDFVGLRYENPDGKMTYCLNSKIADARIRFAVEGRPPIEATTRAMAFEVGTKDRGHGVRLHA